MFLFGPLSNLLRVSPKLIELLSHPRRPQTEPELLVLPVTAVATVMVSTPIPMPNRRESDSPTPNPGRPGSARECLLSNSFLLASSRFHLQIFTCRHRERRRATEPESGVALAGRIVSDDSLMLAMRFPPTARREQW